MNTEIRMFLKTVDQHNAERRQQRKDLEEARRRTGVQCPTCSTELLWPSHAGIVMLSLGNHSATARCPNCSVSIELEA